MLEVHTDRPGVQVYTGAHFDGTVVGLSGRPYGPRAGIALETQGFPDAPNHEGFPDITLRPGRTLPVDDPLALPRVPGGNCARLEG